MLKEYEVEKLMIREVKEFAQGHTVEWGLDLGPWAPYLCLPHSDKAERGIRGMEEHCVHGRTSGATPK